MTAAANSTAMVTTNLYGFVVSTVTNPSTVGTFYARILTYNLDTGDIASYAPGTEGTTNLVDYGGVALSTVNNITITAKVQESLTFCTSGLKAGSTNASPIDPMDGSSGGSNCTAATTPTLALGHGTPAPGIVDNTAVDQAFAYTQASTNATSGLAIRMHATNSCANAGLSSNGGSTCSITGSDNTAAAAVAAGTSFFGLLVSTSSTTSGVTTSTGTITPDPNYNDGTHNVESTPAAVYYGMDNTANSGVTSTYGDLIASSAGPVSQINNHLMFGATASLTVPAGIYTGAESIIATGTF
jgi:hypothetical protein